MARTKFDILIATQALVINGVLEADPRFLSMDLAELLGICNGCGTEKSSIVPDTMYGLYIGYCCYIHDLDYFLGMTEADRKFADDRFKRNLLALVKASDWKLYIPRKIRVNTYHKTVRICGEQAFWAKKEHNVLTLKTYHPNLMVA